MRLIGDPFVHLNVVTFFPRLRETQQMLQRAKITFFLLSKSRGDLKMIQIALEILMFK